jgi:hypothetical protein
MAIFRLAALTLLLLTGVELFACEMIAPQNCEEFGYPRSGTDGSSSDNCICCCTHIVIVMPAPIFALAERTDDVTPLAVAKSESAAFSIYHPPRI